MSIRKESQEKSSGMIKFGVEMDFPMKKKASVSYKKDNGSYENIMKKHLEKKKPKKEEWTLLETKEGEV